MFLIILIVLSTFQGLPQDGKFTITTHDRQEESCTEFLNSKDYKDYIQGFFSVLESYGNENIEIKSEECIDLSKT